MTNQDSTEKYDTLSFGAKLSRYCDWMSLSYQSGDMQEYRRRIEAIALWLLHQYEIAPSDQQPHITLYIEQLRAAAANLPKLEGKIPDLPKYEENSKDESIRKLGIDSVSKWKNQLSLLPSRISTAISYCFAASERLAVPNSPSDCDHLFAFLLTGFGYSLGSQDLTTITESIDKLKKWSVTTSINPGYSKEEVIRCINTITDTSAQDTPPDNKSKTSPLINQNNPSKEKSSGSFNFVRALKSAFRVFKAGANLSKPWIKTFSEIAHEIETTRIIS